MTSARAEHDRIRMKKKLLIPIIAGLGVAAAVVAWASNSHRNGDRLLKLYGNVDIRDVNVGFRVSGRVAEVLKDEGDAVHAGEVLARLDDEPYLREADQAKDQVSAA